MEKRVLVAVLLMSAVILVSNLLFPPQPQPGRGEPAASDSAMVRAPRALLPPRAASAPAPTETVTVRTPLARYALSTRGAALLTVELPKYPSYTRAGEPVQLVPSGVTDFLAPRVTVGRDTLDLAAAAFQPSARALNVDRDSATLRFVYAAPAGIGAEVTYTFRPDRYAVDVRGRVTGVPAGALLVTNLGTGLAPHEAADHRSEQELALVALGPDGVETERLAKIRGTETIAGPLAWAGFKDKYFLAALVADSAADFVRATAAGLPPIPVARAGEDTFDLPRATLQTSVPLGAGGTFSYRAYLGPLEHGQLVTAGRGLEDVNPYGYRWLRVVVRPIAAGVLWVLAFLHDNLGLRYGWVLILFGVMMRVVLWPLNAKAMRAQMRNMAVQPLMQEIQTKYKSDPQKQQQEMIRLYKEHGFNPVAGCLPMLVPMPVLITLFFVFRSSIEFRGARFLWFPDLSLHDPLYILPVFLVASMFALQWVSTHMSGTEPNPQMKMMMYVMPLMMGVFFFNLPAGLNLYYATTNVASIPQQLLIARERRRAQEEAKRNTPPPAPSRKPAGKRRR